MALRLSAATSGATASHPSVPACADRYNGQPPRSAWPPARRHVLPPGAKALRLCRYFGLNTPHPGALAASVAVTRPPQLRIFARELNSLRHGFPFAKCPADDGSVVEILAGYPRGRTLLISIDLRGCTGVSNGDGYSIASQRLLKRVERLTHYAGPLF